MTRTAKTLIGHACCALMTAALLPALILFWMLEPVLDWVGE